jgi:predicted acetylornithine/succinylornithine family transaminase
VIALHFAFSLFMSTTSSSSSNSSSNPLPNSFSHPSSRSSATLPFPPLYGERDLVLQKGQGCRVWDSEGREYLDCVSGVAVNALGHGHPAVLAAIRAQVETFVHGSNLYLLPSQIDLARRLVSVTGYPRVFFCNSGTEANEAALKIARRHRVANGQPWRMGVLAFEQSFHGRTYASMTATGQAKIYDGFGPLPGGFKHVAPNDVTAFRAALSEDVGAILFEPILAEGGLLEHSPEMIEALKSAQEQGILLIADEVQTGLGRTGTFLACESLGLKPDLVTLAKPLGGGFPLGAVLMREEIAASLKPGDHGSTFGGNPVACAAGLAVVETLLSPGFMEGVQQRGKLLRDGLNGIVHRGKAMGLPLGPVRGKGFLLGFPYGGDLPGLIRKTRDRGVLVYRAGTDVLRVIPPLILSEDEIGTLLDALEKALGEA